MGLLAISSESPSPQCFIHCLSGGESIDYNFEISLCERCADRNASNYHAWSHRMWTLDKDPGLLRYELLSTEKFIRRHISDYSAFHHRAVVLRKLYAHQLFDSGGHLDELIELLETHTGYRAKTTEKLVRVLLPVRFESEREPVQWLRSQSLNTFLRTLNWIAYDLKMMDELSVTFGERETFHCHRRSLLEFLHVLRTEWDKEDETRLSFSPVSKIFRRSTSAEREFGHTVIGNGASVTSDGLVGTAPGREEKEELTEAEEGSLLRASNLKLFFSLYRSEAIRSERHRSWCRHFLGFEFDEKNNADV